jgi:hypothetical protein
VPETPTIRRLRDVRLRGLALTAVLVHTVAAHAAGTLAVRSFRIESEPPGAEVYTISGRIGVTPLSISERAIYPNTYPDDKAALYGMVVIRKAGCEEYRKRVTLDDVGLGIKAALTCARPGVTERVVQGDTRPVAPRPPPGESLPQKRLRQLKVLQELLDEGLVTPEEERTIRGRILDAYEPPPTP